MSSSTPHPATQIAAANDRYLMLKTLILDYRKLVEGTMVPIAETAIANADMAQTAVEEHLGKASNQKETMEGAAIRISKRTAARELLSRFEQQMASFEKLERLNLDKIYDSDDGYQSLKAANAAAMLGIQINAFVNQFRELGRELHDIFARVNKYEAERLRENNEVWKQVMSPLSGVGPRGAWEFVKVVELWSKTNL